MNNILIRIKRFISNKNTITILCVLAGVAVLLVGYVWRVNQAVDPVKIPYALKRMLPKTKVEDDMIGTIEVSGSFVKQNKDLIDSKAYILNKDWYVNYDTVIPEGSLLYKSQLVEKKDIPDTSWDDIPDGATIFSLSVNSHSTYGDSIMPDNFIDLYIKTTDEDGKVVFGKFIESIKVLAVRDGGGNDVFADSQTSRSSSELLFAVKNDLFLLLSEAVYVGGIDIVPVPRNAVYREEGANKDGETGTRVSREELMNLILEKVSEISDEIASDLTAGVNGDESSIDNDKDNNSNNPTTTTTTTTTTTRALNIPGTQSEN